MALFAKDHELIIKESIDFLKENTNITSTGPGSKMRTLLEIMRKHLREQYATFDVNTAIGFVHGATGFYLDYIGETLGVKRFTEQSAHASGSSLTVKFFTYENNFGQLNKDAAGLPNDINLNAGTKIWGMKNGVKVVFTVQRSIILPKDSDTAYVEVKAVSSGSASNVQPAVLKYHDFKNYADAKNQSLLVTNVDSIDSGIDGESDDDYRYRIINTKLSEATGNLTALRMAALQIPGVADVNIVNRYAGLGTVLIYLKSTEPVASQSLIQNVQDAVDEVAAAGIRVTVVPPVYTAFTIVLSPKYKQGTSAQEIEAAEISLKTVLIDYMNNLDLGEPFILNNAATLAMMSHPSISSIGVPGKFFEQINAQVQLYNNNLVTKRLNGDYIPHENEKVIASAVNPIIII